MATKKSIVYETDTKTKKANKNDMQSFKISPSDAPFLTFAITRQTLYWTVISVIVLAMGLRIIHLQNTVNQIYDTIELNQAIYNHSPTIKLPIH